MKELLTATLDILDEIMMGNLEKVAGIAEKFTELKKTYIPSMEEQANLKDEEVALILEHGNQEFKKFANYTPELALMNMQILTSRISTLPEELVKIAATNLTAAAYEFKIKIPASLEKYASKNFINNRLDISKINRISYFNKHLRTLTKTASLSINDYALPAEKKYPIHDKLHLGMACSFFEKHADKFPIHKRVTYAKQVAKKIEDPPESIKKYANLDTKNFNGDMGLHLQVRKSFVKDKESAKVYDELQERSREFGPIKTAALLYLIDEKFDLPVHYNRGLTEPVHAVMNVKKEASIEVNDRILTQSQLNGILTNPGVNTYLDDFAISELKKEDGLDAFVALPSPTKTNLLSLME